MEAKKNMILLVNNCDCGYKDKYNLLVKELEFLNEDIKVLRAAKEELEEEIKKI